MSASDLVPRVVLFLTDLKRENDELKSQAKEQEDQQLLVQITGPNRTPIHYEGSLKNGQSYGDNYWRFDFDQNNGVVRLHLPLSSSFTDLEIWVGGMCIETFRDIKEVKYYDFSPDDDYSEPLTGRAEFSFLPGGLIHRGRGPVQAIYASIGPMTYADCSKMIQEQRYLGEHMGLEEQISLHDDLNLEIRSIFFRKDKISWIMSLLEKMGIPTTLDDYDDSDGDNENDDDDDNEEDDDDDDDGDGDGGDNGND